MIQTGILARAMMGDLLRAMIDVKACISQVKCIDRGPASPCATYLRARLDKQPYRHVPDTSRKCDTNTTLNHGTRHRSQVHVCCGPRSGLRTPHPSRSTPRRQPTHPHRRARMQHCIYTPFAGVCDTLVHTACKAARAARDTLLPTGRPPRSDY